MRTVVIIPRLAVTMDLAALLYGLADRTEAEGWWKFSVYRIVMLGS